jgi:hypothetical protein
MDPHEPADLGFLFRLAIRYSDECDRWGAEIALLSAQAGASEAELDQLQRHRASVRAAFEQTQAAIAGIAADHEPDAPFVLVGIAITPEDCAYWSALLQANMRALQALERERAQGGNTFPQTQQIALQERRARVDELQRMLAGHSASPADH